MDNRLISCVSALRNDIESRFVSLSRDQFRRMNEVFEAACAQPADARRSFVERACGDQPEIAAHVLELLAHDEQPAVALDEAPLAGVLGSIGARLLTGESEIPDRIGSYRVLSKLGEGGFGVVYLAEQENPRRQVAIKVMRPGFYSPQLLRRFESEAHALGRLQHVGIAQIHEAGVADVFTKRAESTNDANGAGAEPIARGVPFFAMEYVRGRNLLQYANDPGDGVPLGMKERLELFARVCDALDHAHRYGVIHRDLKPDNILVEDRDESNAADAVRRSASEPRARAGRASGTLLSPLSLPIPKILDFGVARLTDSDVQVTTTRTDVGQLVGTLPYMSPEQVTGDPGQIDARSDVYSAGVVLYELLTGLLPYDVRNRPLLDALRVIRENDPRSLSSVSRTFRGDIAIILATALEKDKTRRYASAAQLAADIRSYLAGEPISARHASALYLMRKRMRRYGVALGVACGFVVLTLASAIWLSVLYRSQSRLLEDVKTERDRSIQAERIASGAQARAELQAQNAQQVSRFLQELLASADPSTEAGREPTVRELLDRAAVRIEDPRVKLEPITEAPLRQTIGRAYNALSRANIAEPHLRRAYELIREAYGSDSLEYADALFEYYAKAGRAQNAEQLLAEARSIYEARGHAESNEYATLLHGLGILYSAQGNLDHALQHFEQGLAINRRLAPSGDGRTIPFLVDIGRIYRMRGEMERAEALVTEAVTLSRHVNGEEHSDTSIALRALGMLRLSQKRYREAETALREALEIRVKNWGEDHPDIAQGYLNLGGVLYESGRYAEAAGCFQRAVEIATRRLGSFNVEVAKFESYTAMALLMLEDVDSAEEWEARALDTNRVALPNSEELAGSLAQMARIRVRQNRPAEALSLVSEGWRIREARREHPAWVFGTMHLTRGQCYLGLGRFADAERELWAGWRKMESIPERNRSRRVECGEALVRLYAEWGCETEAEYWRQTVRAIEAEPPDE